MNKQYPPSGVLFERRNKRNDRAPDYGGELEISAELLRDLADRANKGEKIIMALSAYRNSHPQRGEYLRLRAEKHQPFQKGGYQKSNGQHSKPAGNDPDDELPF
jgi:hypothetical protein